MEPIGTRKPWTAVVLLVASAPSGQAQPIRPAYEVAVIKPDNSGSPGSSSNGSKGQIVFTNQTLKRLIERAYGVKPFQVSGPGWMETVHFDITAKYPADSKSEDRPLMLRTLLEDRFRLAVHVETRDMPGYALVEAKNGFKLHPVAAGDSDTSTNGGRVRTLTAQKTPMSMLADILARNLGELVVDQTGLAGVYDFELRWANDDSGSAAVDADNAPSVFTALQETLGLRLQSQKIPAPLVVVDHVERAPTEN